MGLALIDEHARLRQISAGFDALLGAAVGSCLHKPCTELPGLPAALRQALDACLHQADPDWQAVLDGPAEGQRVLWRIQRLHSAGPARQHLALWGVELDADVLSATPASALQEQALHSLVYEDELTGLLSRYGAREQMLGLVEQRRRFGVLIVKPRDFRLLRDNFGPEGADEVLVSAAKCLRELLPAPLLVSRSVGVEFCVIVPGADEAELQRVGRSILQRFVHPLHLNQTDLVIPICIGIAAYPGHGATLEEVLRNADTALHSAQEEGGRIQRVYDPRMQQRARERLWLDHHLRKALELQQLELHYQPKLLLSTGAPAGVEALLRWRHPKRGLIRPDLFIARAEDNGQIAAIGRWVLVSAATQAAQWAAQGMPTRIAVNISARQLSDPDLLRWLSECQRVAHGLLDVELTESSVISDQQGVEAFMQECRTLGYQIYLDDFGTGFSSLALLARLPIEVIKLDRSFLRPGANAERSQALMKSVVSVARELQLSVIAEGVETREQERFLKDIGVDGAQGWLYAAAMPAADYGPWLKHGVPGAAP